MTEPARPTSPALPATTGIDAYMGYLRLLVVAALAALVVLGGARMVLSQVETTIRTLNAGRLATLLHAEELTMDAWFRDMERVVGEAANDAAVLEPALALLATHNAGVQAGALRPVEEALRGTLHPLLEAEQIGSFVLCDQRGNPVLSEVLDAGSAIPMNAAELALVQRALAGRTVIDSPAAATADEPWFGAASPVRAPDGSLAGALLLRVPSGLFASVLVLGRAGDSGETYVFDRQGRLLSESRFAGQLAEWGLLPTGVEGAALQLELRDPGADLTASDGSADRSQVWPLTEAVRRAADEGSGSNLDGYRDYRGVKVIGAWTWLPDHGIGLVAELDHMEAFRALNDLRRALYILVTLLIVIALVALGSAIAGEWYRTRSRRVESELSQLGRYKVGESLGAGAMGEVFRATHSLLRRPAAIKVVRADDASPEVIARFEREVQLTSELTHPNTIAIYDYGEHDDGSFYYVMEYLEGCDVEQLVQWYGALPPERVIHLLLQMCGSLAEAHESGLIHRDIKPANVFVCRRGNVADFVKVLDFGLAKDLQGDQNEREEPAALLGTPSCMAPELFVSSANASTQSDVYALGAVAWYMACGSRVFEEPSVPALFLAHRDRDPGLPSDRLGRPIDPVLEQVIVRCLAKSPADRPRDAREVAHLLATSPLRDAWTAEDAQSWWVTHRPDLRTAARRGERSVHRPVDATVEWIRPVRRTAKGGSKV